MSSGVRGAAAITRVPTTTSITCQCQLFTRIVYLAMCTVLEIQARTPHKPGRLQQTQHGVEVRGAWRGVAMGTVDGVLRAMAVAKPAINSHRNKCRTRAYVFNMQHSLRAHAVAHTVTLRITHGMR